MMVLYKIVLGVWIFSFASISIITAEVILTHSPDVGFENTALTLSCQYNGALGVNTYDWRRNGIGVGVLTYDTSVDRCSAFISPDASLYKYSCPERNIVTLTILNLTQRNNGDVWNCELSLDGGFRETSNMFTIIVQVPVTSVEITAPTSTTVTVKENTLQVFKCRTSISRPIPTIQWYLDDGTATQDRIITDNVQQTPSPNENVLEATTGTLSYRPTRLVNGWQLYCSAQNIVSSRKSLNITYPPSDIRIESYTNDSTYSVIAGKQQSLTCRSIDSNPPATFHWVCFTGSSSDSAAGTTVTSQWRWTTYVGGRCTCVSVHIYGNKSYSLNIKILDAVNDVKFHINNTEVSGYVKVIHDSTEPIICSASGTPTITYRWTHGTMNVTGERLFSKDILQDGTYTCSAYNTLIPTQGQQEHHISTSSLDLIRLYEPVVHPLSDIILIEGRSPSTPVVCQVTQGNPAQTNIKWTRDIKQVSSQNGVTSLLLPLSNVQRSADGTYECTAENTMDPTKVQTKVGRDSKQFQLTVFYDTSIIKFEELDHPGDTEVTVMESDLTHLNCSVDSKPGSSLTISKGLVIKINATVTNNLLYTIQNTTCLDTGIYTCVGFNDRTGQVTRPSMSLQIYVKCGPRLSPITKTDVYQTGTQKTISELQVYILAYPAPTKTQLIWKKRTCDALTVVQDDRVEKQVSTSGIFTRASLLIHNVQQSDFGEYQLHVEHEVYNTNFTLFFNPKDVPDAPTHLIVVPSTVTETSVVIQWNTGFNGGLEQTFVVMYWKDGNAQRTVHYVNDTNTLQQYFTIIQLDQDTNYNVQVYAFNSEGSGALTRKAVAFKTLLGVTTRDDDLGGPVNTVIGASVGSVLAVVVIVIVIVFVVRRMLIRNNTNNGRQESVTLEQTQSLPTLVSRNVDPADAVSLHERHESSQYEELQRDVEVSEHYSSICKEQGQTENSTGVYINTKLAE